MYSKSRHGSRHNRKKLQAEKGRKVKYERKNKNWEMDVKENRRLKRKNKEKIKKKVKN